MHEVLDNRLGGLSLPRKSVVRLTDRHDMTLDVYRGRQTTIQQYNNPRISRPASETNVCFFFLTYDIKIVLYYMSLLSFLAFYDAKRPFPDVIRCFFAVVHNRSHL